MERTPWKLPHGTHTIEVTTWNINHESYFMELIPLKLPHGTYIIEFT